MNHPSNVSRLRFLEVPVCALSAPSLFPPRVCELYQKHQSHGWGVGRYVTCMQCSGCTRYVARRGFTHSTTGIALKFRGALFCTAIATFRFLRPGYCSKLTSTFVGFGSWLCSSSGLCQCEVWFPSAVGEVGSSIRLNDDLGIGNLKKGLSVFCVWLMSNSKLRV